MEKRVFNFSAGPAMLPFEVLQASAQALLDFKGKGYGIAEISHRGKDFDAVLDEAIARLTELVESSAFAPFAENEEGRAAVYLLGDALASAGAFDPARA